MRVKGFMQTKTAVWNLVVLVVGWFWINHFVKGNHKRFKTSLFSNLFGILKKINSTFGICVVVYTKTDIQLSVVESGGYLPHCFVAW